MSGDCCAAQHLAKNRARTLSDAHAPARLAGAFPDSLKKSR
jgi:hypothetical protein